MRVSYRGLVGRTASRRMVISRINTIISNNEAALVLSAHARLRAAVAVVVVAASVVVDGVAVPVTQPISVPWGVG